VGVDRREDLEDAAGECVREDRLSLLSVRVLLALGEGAGDADGRREPAREFACEATREPSRDMGNPMGN